MWAYNLDIFEASTVQNANGEQLVVRKNKSFLLVARCSADLGEEWLAQKLNELVEYNFFGQKRRIEIYNPEIRFEKLYISFQIFRAHHSILNLNNYCYNSNFNFESGILHK